LASYAAFLRGVNLGTKRKASSSDLRTVFEGLDYEGVAAFRTSGNVVFEAPRAAEGKLVSAIEKALAKSLGFDVTVFLRTEAQIGAIAGRKPFPAGQLDASKGKLQVSLLPRKPSAGARKKALAEATEEDKLAFGERELFWLPKGGTQDSTLDRAAIEKLVGPTTQRTMGTIEQLAAKFFSA
jgi:uncharacterized protein (DUF1697 family)